jgi:UDP-N-acetylglucosamine 3-dehydrogenase
MSKLRAGLVGLGMMGRNHARVLRSLDGVELVGVSDFMGDPTGAAAGVPVYRSVEELIGQGLDMCVVATPTVTHEAIGTQLADAGVAALIEKPVAQDAAAAERLVAAFEAAGVVGCVGHIERYNPALQQMRARLEAGALGDVYQVVTRRQGPFPARISDVGVIFDLATHDIDLTAWVTQQPYRLVSAQTAHRSGRHAEDLVSVVGQLGDGTVVNHLVNWLSPLKERVTVVTGERGCFVADTLTADLTYYENATQTTQWDAMARFRGVAEGNMTRFAIPKPEPLVTELGAFAAAVRGEDTNVVTLRQGLATVQVAEAVRRAATTGQNEELAA